MVKYLGVYIDDRLHFSQHIKAQRKKAVAVFGKLHNLFYNKYLSSKIKIIAYLCLIRPILTYACPVWFDISPNAMVGLRKLERKILRACLNKYRQPESNFWKFISNVELYKLANIPRIDVFIIKLIRNHIKEAIKNKENPLIYSPFFPNPQYHKRCMKSGFMPPEVFKYLDENKFICNTELIRIIYHKSRHMFNKKILYKSNDRGKNDFQHSYQLTNLDKKSYQIFNTINRNKKKSDNRPTL